MDRIEDLSNKSELITKYYQWLLDSDSVILEKELDVCLGPSDRDPFIYYPECMHDLFHTECLQKLDRISQLSVMYQTYPGAWHSRLEHSIAVFGKKQEEHLYLWMNNPGFVKYVEENGLKNFLLAEEIKMLYHDVGHFPFSHVTEHQILGKTGIHEEIGKSILLTDPEVIAATQKLGISKELQIVLNTDVLNSLEHDEGNIDVDRKAYLQSDSVHIGGQNWGHYPVYSRKIAETNPDGSYKKDSNGRVILTDSLGPHSKYIDVYSYTDFSQLENFLYGREALYRDKFYHPTTLTHDTILGLVQSKVAPANSKHCPNMMDYIAYLKNGDFKSAKKYDEVEIFKSLIDLGLNSDNPDVVDIVSLIFVPFNNWLNLINARLDKTKDADFIRAIYEDLIKGNSRFAHNIRNRNFFDENVVLVENENANELKRKGFPHLVHSSHSLSAYDSSNPVYVEDENGNVLAMEDHPDRSRDWSNTRSYSNIAICIVPWLRLQGLSSLEVNEYVSQCRKMQSKGAKTSVIGDHVRSYFSYDDDDNGQR